MDFEEMQKAWQAQGVRATITVPVEMLLQEVQRNQEQFRATIFWRDVREVGVAFLLAAYFAHRGLQHHYWPDDLSALTCFGVGLFMVVDRVIQRRKQPVANDSLRSCVEISLHQVKHQIWLLRNVGWWYLLPLSIGLAISTGMSIWAARHHGVSELTGWGVYVVVGILLYRWIYRLNQGVVERSLEPRRRELEGLLGELGGK